MGDQGTGGSSEQTSVGSEGIMLLEVWVLLLLLFYSVGFEGYYLLWFVGVMVGVVEPEVSLERVGTPGHLLDPKIIPVRRSRGHSLGQQSMFVS